MFLLEKEPGLTQQTLLSRTLVIWPSLETETDPDGLLRSAAPDIASKILLVKLILELVLCEGGNVSFQEDSLNHSISEALWDSKREIKT